MQNRFFAMLARMKLIRRWGLMFSTRDENLSEHSLDTAFFMHALLSLHNRRFLTPGEEPLDLGTGVLLAIYHDAAEILTGDLPKMCIRDRPGPGALPVPQRLPESRPRSGQNRSILVLPYVYLTSLPAGSSSALYAIISRRTVPAVVISSRSGLPAVFRLPENRPAPVRSQTGAGA